MLTKILKTSLFVKVIAIFGKYTNICFQKIPTPGLMLYLLRRSGLHLGCGTALWTPPWRLNLQFYLLQLDSVVWGVY